MAGNKSVVAIAVFAGLSLIGITNFFAQQSKITARDSTDQEAFAQTMGIRENITTVTGSVFNDVELNQVVISFGLETQALTADQA